MMYDAIRKIRANGNVRLGKENGLVRKYKDSDLFNMACDGLSLSQFTVKMKDGLAVRLYSDSRPHNFEIAELQKGLVLVRDNKELIGEGSGFGSPAVLDDERTYFSRSADVKLEPSIDPVTLKKVFNIDTVIGKEFYSIQIDKIKLYRAVVDRLIEKYRTTRKQRRILTSLMKAQYFAGIRNVFKPCKPLGKIAFIYQISSRNIHIDVNLIQIGSRVGKILVMNEQSAEVFRRYIDSENTLYDSEIGPWEKVAGTNACFSNLENILSFSLTDLKDVELYRGREYIKGRLAWAGLNFIAKPNIDHLEYCIDVCLK